MKALTITSDERFAKQLHGITNTLERLFNYERAISISSSTINGRKVLEIKISDANFERRVVSVLVTQLAKLIVTDAKSHYIQSNMRLVIPDEVNRHAFIRALCSFDKETDFLIAKSLLVLTPHFALDSFYDFRITPLKKRWQEVCHLANDNQAHLICPRTFCELLRFLISNIDSKCDEFHVRNDGSTDVAIVTRLVDLAPRKIIVHKECNAALANKIKTLFGKSVAVL